MKVKNRRNTNCNYYYNDCRMQGRRPQHSLCDDHLLVLYILPFFYF